jgi:hypothetical protein
MVNDSTNYIPFSQRTGLEPIPPQLKLGEVSTDLRRLLYYYVSLEIDREQSTYSPKYFSDKWKRVAQDLWVLFLKQSPDDFNLNRSTWKTLLDDIIRLQDIGQLFDLVEFLLKHEFCSELLKHELAQSFISVRSAYRVFDNQYIAAIGTEEQAGAFERAISDAELKNATAVRAQLITAGLALRNAEWANCVRESIHAVEATAVRLAPETKSLGAALAALEKRGHLHGGLKAAFGALYGYSSDEEGVRHALVFESDSKVDETDALFMLGACASFVSYLLSRSV